MNEARKFMAYMVLAVSTCCTNSKSEKKAIPLVINTWAFREANLAAWNALNTGCGALTALVKGCSTCEDLQCDKSVGYGGSPDEIGETTLDAMIMDGSTMNIGAVAGLRAIKNAIGVARAVLEHTQHSFLVGEAATNFAVMMGFKCESLTTTESKAIWQNWKENNCQPNYWHNVYPNSKISCGPYKPLTTCDSNHDSMERYGFSIGRWNHDTIGMIVIDEESNIYAGTSTNGATHKIPGRVGDSPIPGAGAYADNEVGAAVATGDGDIMMRFLPSLIAVEGLRSGQTPKQAASDAINRIRRYYPDFSGGLIVTDRYGNYSAACAGMEEFPFSVSNSNSSEVSRVEYIKCPIEIINRTKSKLLTEKNSK